MSNIKRSTHQPPVSSLRPQARPTTAADNTRVAQPRFPGPQPSSNSFVLPADTNGARARAAAAMDPASFTMPDSMGAEATAVYNAIKSYPGSGATDAQAKEMAQEIVAAAKEFGVDYKIMTAIIAQESKFDPDARSSTGAGGLGQLTNVAIDETRRVAREGRSPFKQHKATFDRIDQSRANRNNIKDNVWTSVAYTRLMQDRGRGNTKTMLQRYNGEPGRRESYPRGVGNNYRTLWGATMPTRAR